MITSVPLDYARKRHDRHFSTDHLHADLKGRSVRGGAITLGAQAIKFVLQVGSTAILARILTPSDYGLIAMVAVFTGFVGIFKDLGLSMATVQRAEITHAQVSTLFWINVGMSALLAAIGGVLSPLVARFYHEPRLVGITIAVSATFIFGGLAAQHTALLLRQMRFKALAATDLTSISAAIVVATLMALYGASYWSLVALLLVDPVIRLVMIWYCSGWRPGMPTRADGVQTMLAFGGNLVGFNFFNYFSRNADNMLIGWYWGASPLGIYSKAYALLWLPIQQINVPIAAVALPTMSRLSQDLERYANFYLRMLNLIMWIAAPAIALLAVSAHDVIALALGPGWQEAAIVFQLLAAGAMFQPVYTSIGWIFMSLGRTDRMLRWSLMAAPISVASFVAGLPFGIKGVAACYTGAFLLMLPWMLKYAYKGTVLTLPHVARAIGWPVLVSVFCFATAHVARMYWPAGNPAEGMAVTACIFVADLFTLSLLPQVRAEMMRNFDTMRVFRILKS